MHWPLAGLMTVPGGQTQRPSEFITFGGGQRRHWPLAGLIMVPGGQTHAPVVGLITFGGGQLGAVLQFTPAGQTQTPAAFITLGGGH